MGRRLADGRLSDRRLGTAALGLLHVALRRVAEIQFDLVEWVVVRRDPLVYGNRPGCWSREPCRSSDSPKLPVPRRTRGYARPCRGKREFYV